MPRYNPRMSTIVWIHGFPLSSQIFERQRAIAGVEHVMPDLPGFGNAPPPEGEPSMEGYARHVLAALDARGIDKAVFAGVSMGGYICFALLRIAPERVAGLILLDTRETADTEEARKGRFDSIAKVEKEGITPIVESMLPKMVASDAYREEVRAIMASSSPAGVMAALRAMADRPDSSGLLPGITVPTLIVVGEKDAITPSADAERMAQAIPNATLVRVSDAAHLANLEKADDVNRAVRAWLAK